MVVLSFGTMEHVHITESYYSKDKQRSKRYFNIKQSLRKSVDGVTVLPEPCVEPVDILRFNPCVICVIRRNQKNNLLFVFTKRSPS